MATRPTYWRPQARTHASDKAADDAGTGQASGQPAQAIRPSYYMRDWRTEAGLFDEHREPVTAETSRPRRGRIWA